MKTGASALPLPSAVIFDMDGLLLDSERAMVDCLVRAASELGESVGQDCWYAMIGKSSDVCRRMLAGRLGQVRAHALMDRGHRLYLDAAAAGVPLRPGVLPLLDWLSGHGIPCAVGTSTLRPLALRKLAAAGLLQRFDAVATSSDVAQSKPAPDIYLLAARELRTDAGDCLVLEDSPTGVRAALAAGMAVIQVPDLLQPDAEVRAWGHRIVASLADVLHLLAQARMAS